MTLPHRSPLIRPLRVIGACVLALGACTSSTRPDADPRVCEQTYEFGNYGCTDITGQVLDAASQPLTNISVGPRYLPDRHDFNSPFARTDADGRFRLRLHRYGAPPPVGPDTVSFYVHAVDFARPVTGKDSVLIQVTVAPVGALAPVTSVVLRLSTP